MRFSARAAMVFQFLMRCASSTITRSGAQAAIRSSVARQRLVVGDLAEVVLARTRCCRCARPPRAVDAPAPCRSVKRANSLCHWCLSEVGHTTSTRSHAEVAREQLGRGDGLDGLAQAHLVADQRPAGARGEQRAFGLVGVERALQQPASALSLAPLG